MNVRRGSKTGRVIQLGMAMIVGAIRGGAAEPVLINDDGGWCWFQDERVIVHSGKLWVVSVANGRDDEARRGNIEVATYDLASGERERFVLHKNLQANDHATPALLVLPDERVFAIYSGHNHPRLFYRVTERPGDATAWTPPTAFSPGEDARVTYANLVRLSQENGGRGRLYNFFRGIDPQWKPSWMTSDDDGRTWTGRGLWIDMPGPVRHRPYVKYTGNGADEIHFVFTEGHPNVSDNSIYHAFYRDGNFHRTDGSVAQAVAEGPIPPQKATRVFAGDEQNIAWTSDLHLDSDGRPVTVYSVQRSEGRLPAGDSSWGQDHRYRYARWDGEQWRDSEIARAGTRLYPGEDDYTGLICLDPQDPSVVFISSDVDPVTGEALENNRYQIFRGRALEGGGKWEWTQLTRDSDADNLRPVVPVWEDTDQVAVVWMRGEYRSYTDYDLEMVGMLLPR